MKQRLNPPYYKPLIFICIGLGYIIACTTSVPSPKKVFFSRQQVQEDFDIVTTQIENEVPFPYYSSSKRDYDSVKATIRNSLHDSMNIVEIYRTLYPLVQILNDAHFAIHLPDTNTTQENVLYFPFKILIERNRLFVTKNLSSEKTIGPGDEILAINGMPAKDILEKIRSCNRKSPSEELFFEEFYGPVFSYRLHSLLEFEGSFSVNTNRRQSITVQGIPQKQLSDENKIDERSMELSIMSHKAINIGYLKVKSLVWDGAQQQEAIKKTLNNWFKDLKTKKINYLILDIRDNFGGSSVFAKDILDHITDQPYTLSWGEEYFNAGKLISNIDTILHQPVPDEFRFTGTTVLLSNALTYSSAHMMAVGFKHYHLGKTIGCTSSEHLFISGEVKTVILPHSKCIFFYPTSSFILPGFKKQQKSHYVPDFEIPVTVKDRLSKNDTMLNFACSLFEHSNN